MSVKEPPEFHYRLKYNLLTQDNFKTKKRTGEVAMVLIAKKGVWVMKKDHYQKSLYRIPTGGVRISETIQETLARELAEETGVRPVTPKELIGTIDYKIDLPGSLVNFKTSIFLVHLEDQVPICTDPNEGITGFKLITFKEIATLAKRWSTQENSGERPYWSEWSHFRSVLHYKVAELLKENENINF